MNRFIFISSLLILCSTIGNAQSNFKNFKWAKQKTDLATIPAQFQDQDAVNIFYYLTLKAERDTRYPKWANTKITVHKRIKILTQNGVDEYSNIILEKTSNASIAYVDAYTVKADGSIVDLDAKEIELNKYTMPGYYNKSIDQFRFSIPGVEVGDEIEIIYQLNYTYLLAANDIYFSNYLPVLHSVISIDVPDQIASKFITYNKTGDPKVTKGGHHTVYRWDKHNLVSMAYQPNSIPAMELPYVSYQLGFKLQDSWDALHTAYVNSYEDKNYSGRAKSKYFMTFMEEQVEKYQNASPLSQLNNILHFVQDSVEIVYMDSEESNSPIGYFLYNRKINEKNLHILYQKIFEYLDIDYYTCFGRDRYNGPIDFNFPSTHQIDEIFYAYIDSNDIFRYIYPSTPNQHYFLNELPLDIEGSEVLAIKARSKHAVRVETIYLKIPFSSKKNNYLKTYRNYEFDVEKGNYTVAYKDQYSGSYLRSHRDERFDLSKNPEDELMKDEYGFIPDTFYVSNISKSSPYKYNVNYELEGSDILQKVDNELNAINLAGIIDHHLIQDNSTHTRYLGYYPRGQYQEINNVMLSFTNPISIMNEEDLTIKFTNSVGSFSLEFQQVKENAILVRSRFVMLARYIPVESIHLLQELNTKVKEAMDIELYLGKSKT